MKQPALEAECNRLDKLVGARVRSRRAIMDVTQTELGDALGITFQQIQKYEAGTNRISISKLILIARALKCSIVDLLEGIDTTETAEVEKPLSQEAIKLGRRFDDVTDPKLRSVMIRTLSAFEKPERGNHV